MLRDHEDTEDGEIVCEGIEAWIGLERVSMRTVHALLQLCALSNQDNDHRVRRYVINETGKNLLDDEEGTIEKLETAFSSQTPIHW